MALMALADVAFLAGDDDRADTLAREAVTSAEESGNALRMAVALITLAQAANRRNRHDEALGWLARSLDISLAIGFRYGVADTFAGIAATRHDGDHAPRAIRLLAAAAVIRDGLASQYQFHEAQFQAACADAPAWAPGDVFQSNWNAGLRLTLTEAVAEAGRTVQAPGASEAALPSAAFGLSPRERDVLEQLAEGRSNAEIGHALGISSRTAAVHVSRILHKLEVNNRAAVVSVAIRHGLVPAG